MQKPQLTSFFEIILEFIRDTSEKIRGRRMDMTNGHLYVTSEFCTGQIRDLFFLRPNTNNYICRLWTNETTRIQCNEK